MTEGNPNNCHNSTSVSGGYSPVTSAAMFTAGVVGNVIALCLLRIPQRKRKHKHRVYLFHILVTCLVLMDLLGTCLISPVVLASYSLNQTLVNKDLECGALCKYFAFTMTFFTLSTMLMLFAMAVERLLSIGCPYFYQRHITKRFGYIAIPVTYSTCLLFCLLAIMGFGEYVQYCPGTWSFIDMNAHTRTNKVYSFVFGSVMLAIIFSILLCNVFVMVNLIFMHRRHKRRRGSAIPRGRTGRGAAVSLTEEVQHVILLAFMTACFMICSLPFTIQAYIHHFYPAENHEMDLRALRFLSFNSIINPWVFIILSPSTWRVFINMLRRSPTSRKQEGVQASVILQSKKQNQLELSSKTPWKGASAPDNQNPAV
ncbi:prostaglandin E2 receptor EP2 subtype-like [Polyodon spathula]|uniref:prostaglandin E2 receptor EP2 subtype-like n=1 Tax=Polyodon spathula TaxID=7913 RepID=UPI001B7DB807|nr:prostaglandin E2 receptor EP2 subtype-like [Polyodon spathula]